MEGIFAKYMRSSCVIYLYPFTKKYKKGAFAEAKASPLYIYLFIKEDQHKVLLCFLHENQDI